MNLRGAVVVSVVMVGFLCGCAATERASSFPEEPETTRGLCKSGKYHAAMRALPGVMAEWAEYTRRTGSTSEGAAGYEYACVMAAVAGSGDAHWGRILDDPEIPYAYKVEMVFEILEARLGKGAAYVANKKYFLVPRHGTVDLDEEMIPLPE